MHREVREVVIEELLLFLLVDYHQDRGKDLRVVISLLINILDESLLPNFLDLLVNCIAQVPLSQFAALFGLQAPQFVLQGLLVVFSLLELVIETLLDVANIGPEHSQRFILHLEFVVIPDEALQILSHSLLAILTLASLGTELNV